MRVAVPPVTGIVYRSPSTSKTIVRPSGVRSREIHDASVVAKDNLRGVINGNEPVLVAALLALSFCAAVCAVSGTFATSVRNAAAITREWDIGQTPEVRRRGGNLHWAVDCTVKYAARLCPPRGEALAVAHAY